MPLRADVEVGAPVGYLVAEDLEHGSYLAADARLALDGGIDAVVAHLVAQLASDVHLRAYVERGAADFLNDDVAAEEESHAGFEFQFRLRVDETELVLHLLTIGDAAQAAVAVPKAGLELGGDVVLHAEVGIALERRGELQVDARVDVDGQGHGAEHEGKADA